MSPDSEPPDSEPPDSEPPDAVSPVSEDSRLVARCPAGLLRGSAEDGIVVFRGIPYALPPLGARRWRWPEPAEGWAGIREAGSFGPTAPQNPPAPGMSIPGDPTEWSEDCLTLNIWTPGVDDARRPVMVWVHGGGFTAGSGASALYDGKALAADGNVVVVTFNYRLGALGYLADPRLAPEAGAPWANWGLADQVAALRWVRECIGAFGGDPGNVTAFGESAGAMSLAVLLASSEAPSLFDRVVLQSGPPVTSGAGLASKRAERFAELAGVAGGVSRDELAGLSPAALIEAANRLAAETQGDGTLPLPFVPVVDGALIGSSPLGVLGSGAESPVPLLIGTTRDETAFFTLGAAGLGPMDDDVLVRRVSRLVGEAAPTLIEAYRSARHARGEPAGPADLLMAISTDRVFRVPSVALGEAHARKGAPVYMYLFTWESPMLGGALGACHALDVPFVFGTVANRAVAPFSGGGPEAQALSRAMMRAWVSFARSGDPSCDELGPWPAYSVGDRPTMVLGARRELAIDPRGEELAVWGATGSLTSTGHHMEAAG